MNIPENSNIKHNPQKTISCKGGSEESGHPLIYLKPNKSGVTICPYCQKSFTNKSPKQD